MKANLLLTLGLMFFCAESFAQDIIHTLDQRPIEAKVLEITDDYVRYKTFDNLDGPDYRMSVSRILRIVFENGTEKLFSNDAPLGIGVFGPISYRHGRFYDYRGYPIDSRNDYLGVALYGSDYRKAVSQNYWGMLLTLFGSALVVSSAVAATAASDFNKSLSSHNSSHWDSWDNSGMRDSCGMAAVLGVTGAACLGAGIPLWISGNRKLNKIADDYNRNYGRGNVGYNSSVELKSGPNGVGLALNF